jgi:indole-3-glycerol phosphate synthase
MQIRRLAPIGAINTSTVLYQVALPGTKPANILEEIVWHKEVEVAQMREKVPLQELQKKITSAPPTRDFGTALRQGKTKPALIAEVKKASPSQGVFRPDFDPVAIAQSYQAGGASCISVLTDAKFFQGSFENLALIRAAVDLPLLCKDFIIYPYQMYWARLEGADAVLLIAAILSDQDLQYFLKIAAKLNLTALIEVHSLVELERVLLLDGVSLIGVNNRNLEDFSVDLQTTCQLLAAKGDQINTKNILVVSESGLHNPEDISLVATAGASAVLIGESLIKQTDPGLGIAHLVSKFYRPSDLS